MSGPRSPRSSATTASAPTTTPCRRIRRELGIDGAPHARFIWCGDGEKRLQSTVAAREVDVFQAFHFLGSRHDIQDVMNTFDVFVLSSVYEGLPYVLLEAILLELPVVATDVIGNRDTVVPGETGLLVPPSDPKALADAVLELGAGARSGAAARDGGAWGGGGAGAV